MKDVSETVSLRMPDGSEYPPKETDRKLEELVGLTKAQFMQVAMIAQGEFMELLRAKSDDKKKIFRRLFSDRHDRNPFIIGFKLTYTPFRRFQYVCIVSSGKSAVAGDNYNQRCQTVRKTRDRMSLGSRQRFWKRAWIS